jgi:hypothetical protein
LYSNSYMAAASPLDLNMRPDLEEGHPGRSFRWGMSVGAVLDVVGRGVLAHVTLVSVVLAGTSWSWVKPRRPRVEGTF